MHRCQSDQYKRHFTSSLFSAYAKQPDAFDLVITDQTMPGLTGTQLAERILKIDPNQPIILCTGFSELVSEEKAKAMGIRILALKPINMHQLSLLIREALIA
ncbi:response regulator [Desulfopila aestuarii]|uniref:Response regulator receiver domain-containing protein n=1 Tax=Desulfopila aestuarii DSM 18488 TaxID=1121416 RepID=A0A1M7Y6L7_9BACT|nr:response regulator [Desulfopila aestuarii]SHO48279.1 Response regulator receiver domain-containing protein [Desulfopila aestuarii DSM 18488]